MRVNFRESMKGFASNSVLTLLAINLAGLIFVECLTRLVAYHGLIYFRHYPTSNQRVLADLSPHYGIWRHPNRKTRLYGACYDVTYETNSFGMRDRERALKVAGKSRHVVLGDSFVEGFGVKAADRFTDILEARTDLDFINFGVSGDFSSTQQYLLYRELASKFTHDAVSVFFLPDNDFTDNDPAYFRPERYRPYLRRRGDVDGYEVYYTVPFANRLRDEEMSWGRRIRRTLYNNIYLFNAVRQLGDAFESSELKDRLKDEELEIQGSSYKKYSQEDLAKLVWGYQKIAQLAYPKPVHIYVIPREVDFVTLDTEEEYKTISLVGELDKSFKTNHPNVRVHDLLPYFKQRLEDENREHDDVFLSCDGHWSLYGHRVVADIYENFLISP